MVPLHTLMHLPLDHTTISPPPSPHTPHHTHLQVPWPPEKTLLRPRKNRLVVVIRQQLVFSSCQGPYLGPFVHICHPRYEFKSLPSGGSICTHAIVEKRLEKLPRSWIGDGVWVPPGWKGEKVDDGAPLAIVGPEIGGVVEGDLQVDDEERDKPPCCCLGGWGGRRGGVEERQRRMCLQAHKEKQTKQSNSTSAQTKKNNTAMCAHNKNTHVPATPTPLYKPPR